MLLLGKLIGLGSDGASNMTGKKGGLVTLLQNNVNKELINIHCFAHRLKLAFRDVLRKNSLYDKLITLLVGLYYFYKKSHKNKHQLLESISITKSKGVVPGKVTGTRWLPHLSRSIKGTLRAFKAYDVHLSNLSHSNAKAEGLLKMLLRKDLICFILFLQVIIYKIIYVFLYQI